MLVFLKSFLFLTNNDKLNLENFDLLFQYPQLDWYFIH